MIFSQPAYFALIAAAALAFRFLPQATRPWFLFASGLLFYAYFSPSFVAILLSEVVAVYALGWIVRRRGDRATLAFALGLTITIGLLVYFKYGGLLTRTAAMTGASGLPSFEDVRLPLAISFFTFEFVHYLIEARRGNLPEHSAKDFLAFALFVPTMVAGPIKRFQGFSEQVLVTHATADDINVGVTRILSGLVKKMVLADTLTLWIAPLGSMDSVTFGSRVELVGALVAYSLRIYFDFSGYSDIAIGSARLFGIRVPENFSWPYLKTDIAAFWRSWHMSLMSWIRDYVYIPLGGSRRGTPRQVLNLMISFAVSGMWHGAAWHFLAWGLYHGSLVSAHHIWRRHVRPWLHLPRPGNPALARLARVTGLVLSGLLTFTLVTIGWGLFAMPVTRFVALVRQLVTGGM